MPPSTPRTASSRNACAPFTPSASAGRCCRSAPPASAAPRSRARRRPRGSGLHGFAPRRARLEELRPTSTGRSSSTPGTSRPLPAILEHPEKGAAARPVRRRQRAARPDRRRGASRPARRARLLAGGGEGRHRARDQQRRRALPDAPSAGHPRRLAAQSLARGLAPAETGSTTTSAASPWGSTAPDELAGTFEGRVTTTARSWPRRSQTAWRKRSPSGSTSSRAGPGTRPRRSSRATTSSPSGSAASGRRSGTLAPTIRRSPRCSRSSRQIGPVWRSPESYASTPGASVSGLYWAPILPLLLRRTHRPRPGRGLRGRRGEELSVVERWLRPNLACDPR